MQEQCNMHTIYSSTANMCKQWLVILPRASIHIDNYVSNIWNAVCFSHVYILLNSLSYILTAIFVYLFKISSYIYIFPYWLCYLGEKSHGSIISLL